MTAPVNDLLYWGDVLGQFQNGCQLDLRIRLAVEFLKGGSLMDAGKALDCATELLRLGEERGLVKPLPEGDELNAPLRAHVRRSIRAQAYQQAQAQKIAQEEAPSIVDRPHSTPLPFPVKQ